MCENNEVTVQNNGEAMSIDNDDNESNDDRQSLDYSTAMKDIIEAIHHTPIVEDGVDTTMVLAREVDHLVMDGSDSPCAGCSHNSSNQIYHSENDYNLNSLDHDHRFYCLPDIGECSTPESPFQPQLYDINEIEVLYYVIPT